jgi:hypothetical protein
MNQDEAFIMETEWLVSINNQLDKIDLALMQQWVEEIHANQPYLKYLLSVYMGRVNIDEHFEILKLHLLVWNYFKMKNLLPPKVITKEDFEIVHARHMSLVNYTDKEEDEEAAKVVHREMDLVKARTLLSFLLLILKVNPIFDKMDEQIRGLVFIDLKCSIECIENAIG